jgi:hypothetical protein
VKLAQIGRAKPFLPFFQARQQIRGHWFELITTRTAAALPEPSLRNRNLTLPSSTHNRAPFTLVRLRCKTAPARGP